MIHKTSAVVLVFNNKGELALQLRAAQDDSYPLHWDFSAGGKVEPGEDPEETVRRELQEEIGIDSAVEFISKELFTGKTYAGGDYTADLYLYRTYSDGPFKIQKSEVEEVKFFRLNEVATMIQKGEKFHPEFQRIFGKGLVENFARQL